MEDPTRIYAIPSSAFSIPRYAQGLNGTQSRTNLVDVNSRGSIFKKRDFYRNTTVLLIFLIILLFLGFIIMTISYVRTDNELKIVKHICTTEECLRTAANLKLSMDTDVNPCDDFYKFSCGRWRNEHPNHGWYPKFSTFETIDERIQIATLNFLTSNDSADDPKPIHQSKDFFKSCLDKESLDKLGFSVIYKYLKEVGLPQVPNYFKGADAAEDFKFDWITASVQLKRIFAMNLFIQFDVDADIFNRTNFVIYVGTGISGAPLPSPFKIKKNSLLDKLKRSQNADDDDAEDELEEAQVELRAKLEESSKNAIKHIMKAILENSTVNPQELLLDDAASYLWNMSIEIAEMANENTTDISNLELRKFKIDELQAYTDECLEQNGSPKMEVWRIYMSKLFDGIDGAKFDFDKDYVYVSSTEVDYLCNILLYLSKIPDSILELYNWWSVLKSMIISTTSDISEMIYKETAIYYEQYPEVTKSRSLDCADLVNNFMGIAVSYGIADKAFMNDTKPKVEQMLNDIKEAFVHRVNKLHWMDKETKEATLEKTKDMISFIGFPDWLLNKTAIEVYYANITITPTAFLENMMEFVKGVTPSQLRMFNKVNEKKWRTDPTTVNAYNYFGDNSINVPMAILTFPLYQLGLEVLNYGAIGSILGHELTHGFDNLGRKYDKDGNLLEWWTNETRETFEDKTECFVKQYSEFYVPSIDLHVDGKLTLGENLADNGGLHHSYQAYQNFRHRYGEERRLPGFENYTSDQMFFIAFGSIWCEIEDDHDLEIQITSDEHSPSKFRVLGTLQNSEDFSRAFKCPSGSKMNPNRTRCRIW